MPRFSLLQLLMGTALLAILLVLIQTDGCETRYAMIETLSFSSDDSRILVTKLTARNAQTPMKHYKTNVARTISWLDSTSGIHRGQIHQDFKLGNSGPAFRHWKIGRTSVIRFPGDNRIVFSAFGGGDITFGADLATPRIIHLAQPATNLAVSKSGRFLSASGMYHLTVLDTSKNEFVLETSTGELPFLGALLMAFNADESRLVTVGDSYAHVWDTITGKQITTFATDSTFLPDSIAIMPDNSLIVCGKSVIKRYDLSGKLLETIDGHGGITCVLSNDGNNLVVSDGNSVTVWDANGGSIKRTQPILGAVSLAVSSNDELLAIGDYDGHVALYRLSNGDKLWLANPPGRHRWPWTIPAVALSAWCWIAYRFSRRTNPDSNVKMKDNTTDASK